MKLNGVMLGTENPKNLSDFYTKAFGEPVMQHDDWYGYSIGGGFIMIGPHSEVKGKTSEPARIMTMIESDDVQKDFESVKAAGAEVIAEPYQPNKDGSPDTWLATLADPDGNYFQLATPWK